MLNGYTAFAPICLSFDSLGMDSILVITEPKRLGQVLFGGSLSTMSALLMAVVPNLF